MHYPFSPQCSQHQPSLKVPFSFVGGNSNRLWQSGNNPQHAWLQEDHQAMLKPQRIASGITHDDEEADTIQRQPHPHRNSIFAATPCINPSVDSQNNGTTAPRITPLTNWPPMEHEKTQKPIHDSPHVNSSLGCPDTLHRIALAQKGTAEEVMAVKIAVSLLFFLTCTSCFLSVQFSLAI